MILSKLSALIAALSEPIEAVRLATADVLTDKKVPGATPELLERASDPDPFVRASLLRALIERRSRAALEPAMAALGNPVAEARRMAISVVGWLQAPQALPAIHHPKFGSWNQIFEITT